MKKFGKAVITCMETGCTNTIAYSDEDYEIPLYCNKHRTDEGRHSQTRVLKKRTAEKKPKLMIFKCPSCKSKKEVFETSYTTSGIIMCECGNRMQYYNDAPKKED